jgi:hypothetical protein
MKKLKVISSEKHVTLVVVLLVTDFLTLLNTYCVAITPKDLIQILSEQRQPRSGRLTFERHVNRLEIPEILLLRYRDSPDGMKVVKANADKLYEDELIFQVDKHRFNLIRTDLRDVQTLMKENSIPEEARVNVDQSSIQMFQDNYTGRYSAFANNVFLTDDSGGAAEWSLDDQCRQGIFSAEFLRKDFIDGLEITEISVGNKDMLRLRAGLIDVDDPSKSIGAYEIDFDPSLGYRYVRCVRFRSDGTLAHEILLSDYRDVGGYLMPFQIKESSFKPDGTLRELEEIKVKTADFKEPITAEDFAIAVPEGTSLSCHLEGIHKHFRLEGQESLTIESIIAKAKERTADKLFYDSLKGKLLSDFENIKIDFSFQQARDKMVMICFWDMNQRPSRHCMYQLAQKARQLAQKGLVIVAIQSSKVDENTLNEWAKKNSIPFTVGMIQMDEEKIYFNWGVKSLPWLILTDKGHIVRAEGFGIDELDDEIKQASDGK